MTYSPNEADFQATVIALAQRLGFLAAHFRVAQTSRGYRTAVQGDGAGFPDLIVAGHGRVLAVELKADRGRLGGGQAAWLEALAAGGVETHVWRPRDWDEVEAALRARRPA